jgi:hypothetical protein
MVECSLGRWGRDEAADAGRETRRREGIELGSSDSWHQVRLCVVVWIRRERNLISSTFY